MQKVNSRAQYRRVVNQLATGAITRAEFEAYTTGVEYITLPERIGGSNKSVKVIR